VRALRKRSGHLKLAGLRAGACDELVKSLFGDVDNAGRVAKLRHERSAGNPRQCMDLAQLLVLKRIARWNTVDASPVPLPPAMRAELRAALANDVKLLGELLNRDLSRWLAEPRD